MSWLTGWTRRKLKIVENLTVSDYQMKLIVHKSGSGPDTSTDMYLGGNCRDDFADIRFTGPDQTTLLSYWIESITGTTPNLVATVWIKVPTLIPTNNIYTYYDNPTASSISNGDNTFIFFDHFPGSSLDPTKWTSGVFSIQFGTGNVTVSNSIATVTGGTNTWWGMFANGAVFATPPFIVEFLYKGTSGTNGTIAGVETTGTISPKDAAHFAFVSSTYDSCNNNVCNSEGTLSPASSYELLRIDVYTGGIKYYINRSLTYTKTTNVPDEGMKPFIAAAQTSGIAYTDWVFVRKYASLEPTFGTSGTEELNITATLMNLNTNTCAGPCQIIAGVTWQNLGSSSVTFTPAVLIDGTTIAYAASSITIGPNPATGSSTITTPTLAVGSHTICPYPN